MSTAIAVTAGLPVTWEQYQALAEDPRVEYVDGRLLVSPSASRRHQQISLELAVALRAVLPPGYAVTPAWAWKPGTDEFIPDLMVHPVTAEELRFTGTPVLAVEILSTNRRDDLVLKRAKYAAAGLPRYWIVDPAARTLLVLELTDGGYAETAHLRADHAGQVTLDLGVAALELTLGTLL